MKRVFSIIVLLVLVSAFSFCETSESIEILINTVGSEDEDYYKSYEGYIINGEVCVQAKPFLNDLGFSVSWNHENKELFCSNGSSEIIHSFKKNKAFINGTKYNVEGDLLNNTSFVSLEVICKGLNISAKPESHDSDKIFYRINIKPKRVVLNSTKNKIGLDEIGVFEDDLLLGFLKNIGINIASSGENNSDILIKDFNDSESFADIWNSLDNNYLGEKNEFEIVVISGHGFIHSGPILSDSIKDLSDLIIDELHLISCNSGHIAAVEVKYSDDENSDDKVKLNIASAFVSKNSIEKVFALSSVAAIDIRDSSKLSFLALDYRKYWMSDYLYRAIKEGHNIKALDNFEFQPDFIISNNVLLDGSDNEFKELYSKLIYEPDVMFLEYSVLDEDEELIYTSDSEYMIQVKYPDNGMYPGVVLYYIIDGE